MREIKLADFPGDISSVITQKEPPSEDIAIIDEEGNIISVIIGVKPYKYLLQKLEEDEEIIDCEELKNFDTKKEIKDAKDFDEFLKGI